MDSAVQTSMQSTYLEGCKFERENNALKTSLRKILWIAEHGMPIPHDPPCGPWDYCTAERGGECEAHAYCVRDMHEAINLIEPNIEESGCEPTATK